MLKTNETAPDFNLPLSGGGASRFYHAEGKYAVLVFYKYSCPTCQLAMPYLQKIYEAYGELCYFVAIAQDGPEETGEFRKQYALTMPVLMDQAPYAVSSQYGLESVPSIFFVNPDRTIRFAGDGFIKQELLNLADVLAEKTDRPQIEVFGSDPVPEFKPG